MNRIFKLALIALTWLAVTAMGGQAWGQNQKVSQAKSAATRLIDNVDVLSVSPLVDVRGLAEVEIGVSATVACNSAVGTIWSSLQVQTQTVGGAFAQNVAFIHVPGDTQSVYSVTGLMDYLLVMATPTGGAGCRMTVWLVGTPFASGRQVAGAYPETYRFHSLDRPLIGGGVDRTTSVGNLTVRVLTLDPSGRTIVVGQTATGSAVTTESPVKIGVTDGTNMRVPLSDTGGRLITASYDSFGLTPGTPTNCAMAAATSCPLTAFAAAGSRVEVFCTVDSFFRFGVGAQVAVTTDTAIAAKTTRRFRMTSTQDSVAFISASAGTCSASVIPATP